MIAPLLNAHVACLLLLAVCIVFNRLGVGDPKWPLALMAVIVLLWCLLALLSYFVIGQALYQSSFVLVHIAVLLLASLPVVGVVGFIAIAAQKPVIHDITTDGQQVPAFVVVKGIRHRSHNAVEYQRENYPKQQQAYPKIAPVVLPVKPLLVFEYMQAFVASHQWQLHLSDQEQGIIEASVSTPIMGFVDDVIIRIRPHNGGTVVDIRSASRIGKSDLGANAARIHWLSEQLRAEFAP